MEGDRILIIHEGKTILKILSIYNYIQFPNPVVDYNIEKSIHKRQQS